MRILKPRLLSSREGWSYVLRMVRQSVSPLSLYGEVEEIRWQVYRRCWPINLAERYRRTVKPYTIGFLLFGRSPFESWDSVDEGPTIV